MASNNLEYLKSKRAKSARAFNKMAYTMSRKQILNHYTRMADLDCQIAQLDPELNIERKLDEDGEERIYIS